ncbi:hypothetical protein SLEP1_g59520 [Rubroshorea leprosula]|uniref:Cation efflux protein cytoplasmic domain-containing protein n=1 Tax=Rubroshorea leprosula TaxID=152421 RepID=A0AAV5MTV4_9ROSI|nr:hypothetical protein SLEP1_g59520 [Rubroshorea leprosula]
MEPLTGDGGEELSLLSLQGNGEGEPLQPTQQCKGDSSWRLNFDGIHLNFLQLALYTIRRWSMTVLENVNSLVGRSATPEHLQKLTYLCWNHHRAIRHIDTVRAYTFGSHYFVEVDIVFPATMPLREAHDIGEALQEKLEELPEIERAFVHLDYEFTHKPEHGQSVNHTLRKHHTPSTNKS